jgi:hypothetical protein
MCFDVLKGNVLTVVVLLPIGDDVNKKADGMFGLFKILKNIQRI